VSDADIRGFHPVHEIPTPSLAVNLGRAGQGNPGGREGKRNNYLAAGKGMARVNDRQGRARQGK
jgi:hypothetical protein